MITIITDDIITDETAIVDEYRLVTDDTLVAKDSATKDFPEFRKEFHSGYCIRITVNPLNFLHWVVAVVGTTVFQCIPQYKMTRWREHPYYSVGLVNTFG